MRAIWLLEELGLTYDIVHYRRDPATMLAPPELRRVHPLGKSPVVVVDGLVLAESGFIIETIVRRWGQGRLGPPTDEAGAMRWHYWMHYAEGSAMPPLLMRLVFSALSGKRVPALVRPIAKGLMQKADARIVAPQLKNHLLYLEAELAGRPWFAGTEFTAADIQMGFPIEAFQARGGLDERYPRLLDWLRRAQDRPARKRAAARMGDGGVLR